MSCLHSRDNSESAYFPETWHHITTQEGDSPHMLQDPDQTSYYRGDEDSITFRCAPMLGASVTGQPEQAQADVFFSQQAEREIFTRGKRIQINTAQLLVTRSMRDQRGCWNTEQDKQDVKSGFENRNACVSNRGGHDQDNERWDKDREQALLVKNSKWRVLSKRVPTVPFYYPLERTHVVVPLDFMSADLLKALICVLCQKLSLAAEYNDIKAIATLTASNGTHFVVNLFGQEDGPVPGTIVECQKMSGDSETFYRNALELLQVAEGFDHVMNMIPMKKTKMSPPSYVSECKEIQAEIRDFALLELASAASMGEKSDHNLACEQIEWAAELLSKDRMDAQDLGMEILVSMTDIAKSSAVVCTLASTAVLRGYIVADHQSSGKNNKSGKMISNLESVFAPLVESAGEEAGMGNMDDDDEETTLFSSSYLTRRRLLSMQILENALRVCCNDSNILRELHVGHSWLLRHMDLIVSRLVHTVHAADDKPHDAVFAIKCLECLMQMSHKVKIIAHDQNIVQAVGRAHATGKCSHAILELESARVYQALMGQEQNCGNDGACGSFVF